MKMIYSKRHFLAECARFIVNICSVLILTFGILHMLGSVTFSPRYEGRTLSIVSGTSLIATGIVGIVAAVSLVQWLIGSFSIITMILSGLAIFEVVVIDYNWDLVLGRMKQQFVGYLIRIGDDSEDWMNLAFSAYTLLITVLVVFVTSAIFSVILLSLAHLLKQNDSTPSKMTKSFHLNSLQKLIFFNV